MRERHEFMTGSGIRPVRWENGVVVILDQTRLPQEEVYLRCQRVDQVAEAIRSLRVRGAPLIGIAAAYGIALAARDGASRDSVLEAAETLQTTRPTAHNLFWAIDRMVARMAMGATASDLVQEAVAIHEEDAEMCRLIGEHGQALLPAGASVLTICNTGALATGGEGTALGIIKTAHKCGNPIRVIACETRPLLQGARLNMWELAKAGIAATLITDSMAGTCMQRGMVDVVIAGADRIARNGDTANKVGTYSLAVLAKHHGVPFYIAAPMSTVDLGIADGTQIPIEERSADEVRGFRECSAAPDAAAVFNPAFDVTPAELITGIVTERGMVQAPYEQAWGT